MDKGKDTQTVASLTLKQLFEQQAYFCITVPQSSFCFNIKTINSHVFVKSHTWR